MRLRNWIRKGFEEHGEDLLREMVRAFAQAMMGAQAGALCVAEYGPQP